VENEETMNVKSPDVIGKKYAARGAAAGTDYATGVSTTQADWAALTTASANNYAAGVQAAIGSGMFQKGVAKAGTDKWKRKASGVGATRYGPGVQAAQGDYVTGVTPYLQVLSSLTLPPRGPKGDPGNINRVNAIAQALRAKKLAG
jgi:hypothetical protein